MLGDLWSARDEIDSQLLLGLEEIPRLFHNLRRLAADIVRGHILTMPFRNTGPAPRDQARSPLRRATTRSKI